MPTRIHKKKTNSKSRKRTQGQRRMSVSRRVTQAQRSRSKRRRQSRALRGGSSGHTSQSKSKKNGLKYAAMAAMGAGVVATGVVMHNKWTQHRQGNSRLTSSNPSTVNTDAPVVVSVSKQLTDDAARACINKVKTELEAIDPCSDFSTTEIDTNLQKIDNYLNTFKHKKAVMSRVWTTQTEDILNAYSYVTFYLEFVKEFCPKATVKKEEIYTQTRPKLQTTVTSAAEVEEIVQNLTNALAGVEKSVALRHFLFRKDQKILRETAYESTIRGYGLLFQLPGRGQPSWFTNIDKYATQARRVTCLTLQQCTPDLARKLIGVVATAYAFYMYPPADGFEANAIKSDIEKKQKRHDTQMRKNLNAIKSHLDTLKRETSPPYDILLYNIPPEIIYGSGELIDEFNALFDLEF